MPTIRTTLEPWLEIVVSDAEYLRLLRQGLIWSGAEPPPPPPSFSDAQYDELDNPNGEAAQRILAGVTESSLVAAVQAAVTASVLSVVDETYATKAEQVAVHDLAAAAVSGNATITNLVEAGRLSAANLIALIEDEGNDIFPVYRVWNGSAYPPRIPGPVNIFFGPSDPGLLMAAGDYWARDGYTTLAEVAAQLAIPGSAIGAAARLAATEMPFIVMDASSLRQDPADASTFTIAARGSSPNQHLTWGLQSTGVNRLYSAFVVPSSWAQARIEAYFYHNQAAATGNVVFSSTMTGYDDGLAIDAGSSQTVTVAAKASGIVTVATTSSFTVTPGRMTSVMFARNAGSAADTLEFPINLLGIRIRRTA